METGRIGKTLAWWTGMLLLSGGAAAGTASGPLRVHPTNPRYFTDGSGKAVYLTGSHTWGNVSDHNERWPAFDFSAYLDMLEQHNHNFARLWHGSIATNPPRYVRTGPGEALDGRPKIDLDKLNPAFFERLRSRVSAAQNRGVHAVIKAGLVAMAPRNALASTEYCLADPGSAYLVDQPEPAQPFTVALQPGAYEYEWFDPGTGQVAGTGKLIAAGGRQPFTAPFSGDAVLFVQAQPNGSAGAAAAAQVGEPLPAFPGAEGFGSTTPGGRGGRAVYVTNLNDSGPGSLRQALSVETGPRFVLFKVSGTIALSGDIVIAEKNSFVTVAGQTAPGDGIQLKNRAISVAHGAHDVVIRHIRCRPGRGGVKIDPKTGRSNGNVINGLLVYGPGDRLVRNVVIDHCSVYWAVDENGEAFGMVQDTTFQWCIFAEGAQQGHEKGPHSMGMLVATSGANKREMSVSVHHCLFAHNGGRNPQVAANYTNGTPSVVADIRNNLIYNWAGNNAGMFYSGPKANFVSNLYIPGPNSAPTNVAWLQGKALGTRVFVEGNLGPKRPPGSEADEWGVGFWDMDDWQRAKQVVNAQQADYRVRTPFAVPPVTTDPAADLESILLPKVGATKPKRDALDARIVSEVRSRTGEVGPSSGYPVLVAAPAPTDTDSDGMPDAWEAEHGLDPTDPTDGRETADNGYTHLENHLNELAE